jgi:hypothetical protein
MSPAKLEANRHNAALSTGPTSTEGKAASSRNATSHGLTSRQSILTGEDPEEYRAFVSEYLDYYRPANSVDRALVIELSDLRWRLRRVPVIETQAWNREMLELSENPENAKYSPEQIMAMAFTNLIKNKVITNLFAQEGRLQGRANRIQKHLDAVEQLKIRASEPRPCPLPPHILEKMQQRAEAAASSPANVNRTQQQPVETEICKNEPIRVAPKPGRNEPCPCGSGLKFKRCCLNRPKTTCKAFAAAA